jgi:hypothetical protein
VPASALRIAVCDSHHLFGLSYAFTSSNVDACEVAVVRVRSPGQLTPAAKPSDAVADFPAPFLRR